MAKRMQLAVLLGAAVVMTSAAVFAIGIPAKLKSKKIQGDLVPAYAPTDTGSNTGDDEGDDPAFLDDAVRRSTACTFTKGQFKFQTGKDGQAKMSGLVCGGTPFTGQLCAHAKGLSTIADEEIDTLGGSSPKTCDSGGGGDVAGKMNWVSTNVGLITCTNGVCKGTLPAVATDPCPDVDKVTEYRRVEVFDGDDMANVVILGTALKACCGPGQTIVGGTLASSVAPCNTSTQDVMAIGGTVLQGIVP